MMPVAALRRFGSLSLILSAVSLAFGNASCRQSQFRVSPPVPKLSPGGQSGAGQINVTFPTPCEADVDFGDVPIGQMVTQTIHLDNVGTSPLDLTPLNPNLDAQFGVTLGAQGSIPPAGSGEITVTFEPYKAEQVQSSFSIQTDGTNNQCAAPGDSVTVKLSGTGIKLSLLVQPNVLDFGNTLINTSSKKSVTLTNQSQAAITDIHALVGGPDQDLFAVDNAPSSLAAGASAVVDISYAPLALETRSLANVSFTAAGGEKTTLNLFGEPVGVALTLSPNPIDFGFVAPQSTEIACTTVNNQANVAIQITGVSSFNTAGGAYAAASTDDASPPNPIVFPLSVAGGASVKVCFAFTPPIPQQYVGQVTLDTAGDPSGSQPVLQLTGWGGGPQITCTPTSIDFGETLDHSVSTVPVICTNTGTPILNTNLMLDPPTATPYVFTATFDQSKDPYPLAGLAPGQSAQIDVSYSPTTASNDSGTLFIKSNGGRGKTLQIPLAGQGLNVPPCQFVLSPTSLDFANVAVGDTSPVLAFEIQNIGRDICLVQGLKIRNDGTNSFHLLTPSIPPDALTGKITIPAPAVGVTSSLTVTVDFAPTVQGQAFSAEAAFSISDPSAPNQVVQLTGTSQSTCLVVVPSTLNFGDVGENDAGLLCSSTSRTFSIFNECQTAATVQALTVQSGPGDVVPQFSNPSGQPLPLVIPAGSPAQTYEVFFEPTTVGTHTAQVLVSDGTAETLISLTGAAVSTGTETDSFVVGPPKADILWIMDVDDDPGEQSVIAGQLPVFFNAAASIDYRIGLTTDNDAPLSATAELGRLVPCPTCSLPGPAPTIISPSSQPDPLTAFTGLWSSLNARAPVGDDEHFFVALYNALQHGAQPGVDFFRPGVFFAAITDNEDDEPDRSEHGQGNHNPTWYANFFESYFQNPFLFTWNYINPTQTVTGTGFSNYLQLPPSIQQMISATNGFALNTKDNQWASALTSVWTSAITAHTYYPLVGSPSEGQSGIKVTVDGVNVAPLASPGNPNWTYQAALNAIVFNPNTDPPRVGAEISVTYPIGCH